MEQKKWPQRKPLRLEGYDYSQNGAYFVTICTHQRMHLLGNITVGQGLAPAEMRLSKYGRIIEQELLSITARYPAVRIDKYVIMPNHIHAIISLDSNTAGASPCPTLSDVVCSFKSLAARKCKQNGWKTSIFQRSFYDHIIRNQVDYREIWRYINTNPQRWESDEFYNKP